MNFQAQYWIRPSNINSAIKIFSEKKPDPLFCLEHTSLLVSCIKKIKHHEIMHKIIL